MFIELIVIFVYNISGCEYCIDVINDSLIVFYLDIGVNLVDVVVIECVIVVFVFGVGFG